MNKTKRNGFTLLALLCVLAVIALIALFSVPRSRAATTFSPNWYKSYTIVMSPSSTSNLATTVFADQIIPDKGESLWIQVNPTNALNSANFTVKCDVSPDRTNFTTVQPFQLILPSNGTNVAMTYTNWPASGAAPTLNNANTIAVTSIMNGTTNFVPVTVWFSHANYF